MKRAGAHANDIAGPRPGLLVMFFYSDVLPESGGTQICVDSVPLPPPRPAAPR
jgi:hypothetical protein